MGIGVLTAASHRRISSRVHVSGSPVGSESRGNRSPPQMTKAVAATTAPPKAALGQASSFVVLEFAGRRARASDELGFSDLHGIHTEHHVLCGIVNDETRLAE